MSTWPTKPFIVVDTETTGLDFTTDRVIQVGIAVFNGSQYIHGFEWLVNNGYPSHPDALATHGITDEERVEHGRDPEVVFSCTLSLINRMRKNKYPVLAFNAAFDFTMLRAEFERINLNFYIDDLYVIDPLVIDRHFQKHVPVFTKPFMRLNHMAGRYGVVAPKHRALADAQTTGFIAIGQSLHHTSIRPLSVMELMRRQEKWYAEWAHKFQSWGEKKKIQFVMPPWPFGTSAKLLLQGSHLQTELNVEQNDGGTLLPNPSETSPSTPITSPEA